MFYAGFRRGRPATPVVPSERIGRHQPAAPKPPAVTSVEATSGKIPRPWAGRRLWTAPTIAELPTTPKRDTYEILAEVAASHGVTIDDIKGPRRQMAIALARHEACYRLRTERRLSYPRIGRQLGNRDHTTILHGVRRHAELNNLPVPGLLS